MLMNSHEHLVWFDRIGLRLPLENDIQSLDESHEPDIGLSDKVGPVWM